MAGRGVFAVALVAFMAAFAMTITSIVIPRWISWDKSTEYGTPVHYTYGLHSRCSSIDDTCEPFPQKNDCHEQNRTFCSQWRSVGFLMSFAVVLEGMTFIAFIVTIAGGKQKRERGWKLLSLFLLIVGAVQCAAMGLIAYMNDHEDRFFLPGWKLDTSWMLCTVSWATQVVIAAALTACALWLSPEGGYELIPETH